jgi:hypothetical protein
VDDIARHVAGRAGMRRIWVDEAIVLQLLYQQDADITTAPMYNLCDGLCYSLGAVANQNESLTIH